MGCQVFEGSINKTEKSFSSIGCAINNQPYRFTLKRVLWKNEVFWVMLHVISSSDGFLSFNSTIFFLRFEKLKRETNYNLLHPFTLEQRLCTIKFWLLQKQFQWWLCSKLNWTQLRALENFKDDFAINGRQEDNKTRQIILGLWGCAANARPT